MRILSLFSGIGGLDAGFTDAGFNIVWANDFDKYAVETYEKNFNTKVDCRDIHDVKNNEIPEFDIKSLSEILGHKNVSFTLNVYGSANLQQKVKCMNLLNDLL